MSTQQSDETPGASACLFNHQASFYAQFRPTYPHSLYEHILKYCNFQDGSGSRSVLDIACGSGQASVELSKHFRQVIAIDGSMEQLNAATQRDNITYRKGLAETTGIDDKSVDLVTVAQALHWFNFDLFFAEAARVLKAGGALAMWGYGYPYSPSNAQITKLIADFGDSPDQMGPYWAPQRRYIEEKYSSITPDPQHFHDVRRKEVEYSTKWTIDALVGYLNSWSPYTTYRHKHPDWEDPLIPLRKKALEACNTTDSNHSLDIAFPIFLVMAKLK